MKKLLLVFIACIGLAPALSQASGRYALIIGNSDYGSQPLKNPRNDAIDMATQLQLLGYKIHGDGPFLDLDREGMEQALYDFSAALPTEANALVYYAGHGIATNNDNYLIPVNHSLRYEEQLRDRTVSLRSVIELLKNANPAGINVVLLDACRDNPLQRSFRSAQQGLQRLIDIPRGIFVGYAADSGQVAEDGRGRNGTYTGELLKTLAEQPDVIIEVAHKQIARRVYELTNGEQFPVSENKVYGNWCFGTCKSPQSFTQSIASSNPEPSTDPELVIQSASNKWKVVGGIVLGVVAAGLIANSQKKTPPSGQAQVQLTVEPPL